METYLILNLLFICIVLVAFRPSIKHLTRPWLICLASLIVLSVIFDNVIIGLGVVGYDTTKILGVYIGLAPIEDFLYAVLAAILVPTLWHSLGESHDK